MTKLNKGAEWLGADTEIQKDTFVAVFVPSEERDGEQLNHAYWRSEAVREMSRIFGGATSVKGLGGWLDEDHGGEVKEEEISMVFSFISEEEWHEENVLRLKRFLYRMGKEAKQGAVGLYVMGTYLEIPNKRYEKD